MLLKHHNISIQRLPQPGRGRWRSRAACPCRAHAPTDPTKPAAGASAPVRCPFALAADFMLAEPRPPRLSPLGEVSVFASTPAPPSPHMWLAAGFMGQDTPGRLVSGLRRLTHDEEFLNQDPSTQAAELAMKRRGLGERAATTFAATPGSLPAQAECLELFLDYLPKRYPELYALKGEGAARTVHVALTGETHRVADYDQRPLELCGRIAQEDLVLMATLPPAAAEVPMRAPFDDPEVNKHVMVAASVVFSFGGLHDKLGQPMNFLHAPVPGFEKDLSRLLNKTLDGLLPDKPVWRNNWALVDTGALDEPSYGEADSIARRSQSIAPAARFLKTEYQTLRRLPKSRAVLFTIRTFVEPATALAEAPAAARSLAESLRGMSQAMRTYKGVPTTEMQDDMLAYLDSLAASSPAAPSQ